MRTLLLAVARGTRMCPGHGTAAAADDDNKGDSAPDGCYLFAQLPQPALESILRHAAVPLACWVK